MGDNNDGILGVWDNNDCGMKGEDNNDGITITAKERTIENVALDRGAHS